MPAFRSHVALPSLALAGLCAGVPAQAQSDAADSAPKPAWRLDAIYKVDLLRIDAPGATRALDLLDAALTIDADALFGWSATTLRIEMLATHGAKPNRLLGTLGGVSNLEVAENSVRLYASWITRDLTPSLNVLAGLYDLNSEFYSTDASALLIHPAFGIGTEFAQSGRNGPSIFPNLSFALRLRAHDALGFYAQAAVLDGTPGEPAAPGRTTLRLSAHEGALMVGEGGWQNADSGGHYAAGTWSYSVSSPRLDGRGNAVNRGVYVLGQAVVWPGPARRTSGFVRFGVADRRVNATDAAFEAGALVAQPLGRGGPSAFALGVTAAHVSSARRRLDAAAGTGSRPAEATAETGLRWRLGQHWSLQPVLQRVWNIDGRRGGATVAGLHIEGALQPSTP